MTEPCPVDFHVHLDLYPDMAAAYRHCAEVRCTTLAVTTTPKAFQRNADIAEANPYVYAALGLHPQVVSERASEIGLFEKFAVETRFIGEIGLDAGREHYRSFDDQKRVFNHALSVCHEQKNKIISVHSARCSRLVLDALEKTQVFETCKVVLHWFSASRTDIERAVDLGCLFSVNERLLLTEPGVLLVNMVPGNRLLTETDGPFISRFGEPLIGGDVEEAMRLLSSLLKVDLAAIRNLIAENAEHVLQE